MGTAGLSPPDLGGMVRFNHQRSREDAGSSESTTDVSINHVESKVQRESKTEDEDDDWLLYVNAPTTQERNRRKLAFIESRPNGVPRTVATEKLGHNDVPAPAEAVQSQLISDLSVQRTSSTPAVDSGSNIVENIERLAEKLQDTNLVPSADRTRPSQVLKPQLEAKQAMSDVHLLPVRPTADAENSMKSFNPGVWQERLRKVDLHPPVSPLEPITKLRIKGGEQRPASVLPTKQPWTPYVPPPTGTFSPTFNPLADPLIEKQNFGTSISVVQTITYTEPYSRYSLEELRLADYNAGRRWNTAQAALIPPWLSFDFPKVPANPKPDTTGGFVFVQSIYSDILPQDDFAKGVFPRDADLYMGPEDIQIIDDAAKDALMMCQVVENVDNDKLFRTFFKDRSHEIPIRMIFRHARELLEQLIDRENAFNVNDQVKLWLVKMVIPSSEATMHQAFVQCHRRLIGFYPQFFEGLEDSWDSWYYDTDLVPVPMKHFRLAAQKMRLTQSRGSCLLHEVVHYVSNIHWKSIKEAISDTSTPLLIDKKKIRMLEDIRPYYFANRISERDHCIMNELARYPGLEKKEEITAYGYYRCVLMKELGFGATASFLNADSYALYASELTARLLDDLWMTWSGCRTWSGMKDRLEPSHVKGTAATLQYIGRSDNGFLRTSANHEEWSLEEMRLADYQRGRRTPFAYYSALKRP